MGLESNLPMAVPSALAAGRTGKKPAAPRLKDSAVGSVSIPTIETQEKQGAVVSSAQASSDAQPGSVNLSVQPRITWLTNLSAEVNSALKLAPSYSPIRDNLLRMQGMLNQPGQLAAQPPPPLGATRPAILSAPPVAHTPDNDAPLPELPVFSAPMVAEPCEPAESGTLAQLDESILTPPDGIAAIPPAKLAQDAEMSPWPTTAKLEVAENAPAEENLRFDELQSLGLLGMIRAAFGRKKRSRQQRNSAVPPASPRRSSNGWYRWAVVAGVFTLFVCGVLGGMVWLGENPTNRLRALWHNADESVSTSSVWSPETEVFEPSFAETTPASAKPLVSDKNTTQNRATKKRKTKSRKTKRRNRK